MNTIKKNIKKRLLFRLFVALAAVTPITSLFGASPFPYWQCTKEQLAQLDGQEKITALRQVCIAHNQMTCSLLLNLMHELEASLEYWHNMETKPFSYAIIRGPKGWLSTRTAHDEMKQHIAILEKHLYTFAHILGTLSNWQTQLATAHTLELFQTYCHESSTLLKTLSSKEYTACSEQNENFIFITLINGISTLEETYTDIITPLYPHLKPSHLVRNWLKYALGVTTATVAGIALYKHHNAISPLHEKAITGIKHIWNKHVKIPLKNTAEILFGHKQYDVITPEAVNGTKEAFQKGLTEILPRIHPEASREELEAFSNHINTTKDSRILVEFWHDQAAHLIWNTVTNPVSGNLHFLEATALLVQLKDLQLNEATLAAQQAWEAQQLNAELFAIFPSLLGVYGCYRIGKAGFEKIFHKKMMSEPIQKRLGLIDRLLNQYNSGDKQLDDVGTGLLIYHVHALKTYLTRISDQQRKAFENDVMQLEAKHFNVEQKLRVIDQMYRAYGFLLPAL